MSCRAKTILDYAKPYWRRLSWIVLLSVASTALSLYIPYLSKTLIDEALLKQNWPKLIQTILIFLVLTVLSYLLNALSGLRYVRISAGILFDMRLELFRHLQRLGPRFWSRTRLGEVLSRLNNDISEVQRVAAETALAWIGNTLFLLGAIVMMAALDLTLLVASLALIPPSLWALRHYRAKMESRAVEVRQSSANIGSFLIESLSGVRLVVASNAQEREADRFRARNDSFVAALMALQSVSYWSGGLPGLILSLGTMLVFLYGGWRVIHGTLTMGTLAAFLAYHTRLLSPVQALMGLYANLATARVSLRRVEELMSEPAEVEQSPDPLRLPAVRGEIEFSNVSLTFGRGAPVLSNLSFRVAPGEVLAITGPSGSGKSTIADLLLRFLDPDSGIVHLDGHDLRTLHLADLRRHVALVEQEPFFLHASIAENLRYAQPAATDEQLRDAARSAGIAEFIEALPEAYATIVGERALALSTGEKQRLALARALLADPSVLVLDEPTSALDPDREREVIAGLAKATRGRTVIVITHRFELAKWADRILQHEPASRSDR